MLKVYKLLLKQNTYDVTFSYRGVSVRCAFEEGNVYNGTPARCYTSDPFKQRAIEASQMFKDKDIVLEKCIAEAGDEKKATKAAPAGKAAGTVATPDANATGMVANQPAKPAGALSGEGAGEDGEAGGDSGDGSGDTMEFQNLGEAIQYIAQTWQIGVHSESEARQVLKEHGITPRIKRG